MNYEKFLESKTQLGGKHGFSARTMPDFLFDFQKQLVNWSLEKGCAAILADCGLGKTIVQLVWAQNVVEQTGKPVLILTPLAVASQTMREGQKFGIYVIKSSDGKIHRHFRIVVTNYERLHYFKAEDFGGVVADESGILKNFDGKTKAAVTEFMRLIPYRLLCTATPAPNDYIELGTSSEALGEMGYMDMLGRFFKNAQNSLHPSVYRHRGLDFQRLDRTAKFRFRGHAERDFWRWVCSWARAVRKPSDLGFDDGDFILPELITRQHIVKAKTKSDGWLFDMPAHGLAEQRDERRRTIHERCEMAAQLINNTRKPAVAWCNLNAEGELLTKLIDGAEEVSGDDSDDKKEAVFEAFQTGQLRVLVTKPKISGLGLNWQHCAHQTFFPSHSFEQFYQAVRRSHRFGQTKSVTIDVITSEGEANVLANLQRKAAQAETMFTQLVALMNNELKIEKKNLFTNKLKAPKWLS